MDKERIIILGAVAGGGDTAAVTAALDPRVAAVAAFNFGGPEPETAYPLPQGTGEGVSLRQRRPLGFYPPAAKLRPRWLPALGRRRLGGTAPADLWP